MVQAEGVLVSCPSLFPQDTLSGNHSFTASSASVNKPSLTHPCSQVSLAKCSESTVTRALGHWGESRSVPGAQPFSWVQPVHSIPAVTIRRHGPHRQADAARTLPGVQPRPPSRGVRVPLHHNASQEGGVSGTF